MARKIEVTPDLLVSAAGAIENLASQYKDQYTRLYSETNAMASTWSGKDNLAYTDQIAGFKDDFEKMYALMNRYATFLRDSAKMYRDTQDAVVTEARRLQN